MALIALIALIEAIQATPAPAVSFRLGEVDGLFGVSLAYGLLARVEGRDDDLIAIANGGSASSANLDDGDLNYDRGITSNMIRGTAELTLKWRGLGAYVRGFGFYDFENADGSRDRTDLSSAAQRTIGWDVDLRDYYLASQFSAWDIPMQVRVGDQVLGWGESRILRTGVDLVNPLDLVLVTQPTGTSRDLRLPVGMVWAAAQLTETIAIEGFYQYKWKATRLPPVGSYYSNNDVLGSDGTNVIVVGAGAFSDLGTDLDEAFALPPGTLGFDEDFMQVPAASRNTPSDAGQFGFTVQAIVPAWNATKIALHFVNYHSRLPMISALTADQEAIDAASPEAIAARAAELAPIYESTGLDPDEAAQQAADTAAILTAGEFAQETSFIVDFPENIQVLGLSFNTALIRSGTLFSGEISHHFDRPYQINPEDVFAAAFSVVLDPPEDGEVPEIGPNQVVKGFVELDATQIEIGLTQLFGPQLGASQTSLSADFGWIHVHDIPTDLRLTASGVTSADPGHFPDEDSFGYRLIALMRYDSLFGGVAMSPRLIWAHDAVGVTPGPGGAFVEDRMLLSPGVAFEYRATWTADLSYSTTFGAGRFDTLNDRDSIRFNLSFNY